MNIIDDSKAAAAKSVVHRVGVTVLVLALVLPSVGVIASALAYALQLGILKLIN